MAGVYNEHLIRVVFPDMVTATTEAQYIPKPPYDLALTSVEVILPVSNVSGTGAALKLSIGVTPYDPTPGQFSYIVQAYDLPIDATANAAVVTVPIPPRTLNNIAANEILSMGLTTTGESISVLGATLLLTFKRGLKPDKPVLPHP